MAKGDASVSKTKVPDTSDWFITEGYRPGKQLGNFARRDERTGQFMEVHPPKGGTSGVISSSIESTRKK
jgi:hypothetical protein